MHRYIIITASKQQISGEDAVIYEKKKGDVLLQSTHSYIHTYGCRFGCVSPTFIHTGSEERGVLGVGSIPFAIFPSGQDM